MMGDKMMGDKVMIMGKSMLRSKCFGDKTVGEKMTTKSRET